MEQPITQLDLPVKGLLGWRADHSVYSRGFFKKSYHTLPSRIFDSNPPAGRVKVAVVDIEQCEKLQANSISYVGIGLSGPALNLSRV